jgi:hypothetical protein
MEKDSSRAEKSDVEASVRAIERRISELLSLLSQTDQASVFTMINHIAVIRDSILAILAEVDVYLGIIDMTMRNKDLAISCIEDEPTRTALKNVNNAVTRLVAENSNEQLQALKCELVRLEELAQGRS